MSVAAQFVRKLVNPAQSTGDIDVLRAGRSTLSAAHAVVCLAYGLDTAVKGYKVCPAGLPVFRVLCVFIDIALVHTFVVMGENGRDVDAVRTRHAILTSGARDKREIDIFFGNLFQKFEVFPGKRL